MREDAFTERLCAELLMYYNYGNDCLKYYCTGCSRFAKHYHFKVGMKFSIPLL